MGVLVVVVVEDGHGGALLLVLFILKLRGARLRRGVKSERFCLGDEQ